MSIFIAEIINSLILNLKVHVNEESNRAAAVAVYGAFSYINDTDDFDIKIYLKRAEVRADKLGGGELHTHASESMRTSLRPFDQFQRNTRSF